RKALDDDDVDVLEVLSLELRKALDDDDVDVLDVLSLELRGFLHGKMTFYIGIIFCLRRNKEGAMRLLRNPSTRLCRNLMSVEVIIIKSDTSTKAVETSIEAVETSTKAVETSSDDTRKKQKAVQKVTSKSITSSKSDMCSWYLSTSSNEDSTSNEDSACNGDLSSNK
ncbi:hypothetical protein Tco_0882671, partial [Tanacetum coccineum]